MLNLVLTTRWSVTTALLWVICVVFTIFYRELQPTIDASKPPAYVFHPHSIPGEKEHQGFNIPNETLFALGAATPPELPAPYPLWTHGPWLMVHHSYLHHATIESQLRDFKERLGADITVVALDAGWHHDLSVWKFSPKRFPRAQTGEPSWAQSLKNRTGANVVLWVSSFIPITDVDYQGCLEQGYFIRDPRDQGKHFRFTWTHKGHDYATNERPHSVEGSLLDMTHPGVQNYLEQKLKLLVDAGVRGLRLGAVDGLLKLTRYFEAFNGRSMVSEEYTKLYYRTFHDLGTKLAGDRSFVVLGSAVDEYSGYPFGKFSPIDTAFVSWAGGEQPSNFYGFRNSILAVAHAAYNGYINPGMAVGGNPGLDAVSPPSTMAESHIDFTLESHGNCHRRRELKLRWLQLGTWLPFMMLSGPHAVNRSAAVDTTACPGQIDSQLNFDVEDDVHRSALFRRRRQHAVFYSTNAARTFYGKLVRGDHWHEDEEEGTSTHHKHHHDTWSVWPVGSDPSHSERIYFADPFSWELLIGGEYFISPTVESFGPETYQQVMFPRVQRQHRFSEHSASQRRLRGHHFDNANTSHHNETRQRVSQHAMRAAEFAQELKTSDELFEDSLRMGGKLHVRPQVEDTKKEGPVWFDDDYRHVHEEKESATMWVPTHSQDPIAEVFIAGTLANFTVPVRETLVFRRHSNTLIPYLLEMSTPKLRRSKPAFLTFAVDNPPCVTEPGFRHGRERLLSGETARITSDSESSVAFTVSGHCHLPPKVVDAFLKDRNKKDQFFTTNFVVSRQGVSDFSVPLGPVHTGRVSDSFVSVRFGWVKLTSVAQTVYAQCTLPTDNSATGVSGNILLQQHPGQLLRVAGYVNNLAPGTHGFHVHAVGDTSDGCKAAGPHFNPFGKTHGGPNHGERHHGDLGNIKADQSGVATVDLTDRVLSLSGEKGIIGRTIVVHADPDDLGQGGHPLSNTTGNAGARLACCVIESSSAEETVEQKRGAQKNAVKKVKSLSDVPYRCQCRYHEHAEETHNAVTESEREQNDPDPNVMSGLEGVGWTPCEDERWPLDSAPSRGDEIGVDELSDVFEGPFQDFSEASNKLSCRSRWRVRLANASGYVVLDHAIMIRFPESSVRVEVKKSTKIADGVQCTCSEVS